MAKDTIRDFSATASANTDIQSVNVDENCAASGINNAIRELMADLKDVSTGAVALETPQADSLTITGNATFSDNGKAIFGSGNDLSVFHDGFNSKIVDSGTGDLLIAADNNITFTNAAISENKAIFTTNGPVTLYHDNNPKFATTASGIDVTGGISFNGDTAAANALDDYEEGTWTPSIRDSSGNVSSTSAASAFYVKVGRLVNVTCQINNFSTAGLTGTEDLRIYGLPYISNGSSAGSVMATYLTTVSSTGTSTVNTYLPNAATYLTIYESRRATSGLVSDVDAFNSGASDFFISHTYQTN